MFDLSGWLKVPENIEALKLALQTVVETGIASLMQNEVMALEGWQLQVGEIDASISQVPIRIKSFAIKLTKQGR